MANREGMNFRAVASGIGIIARVALSVPVGMFAYCWAMGFGWLVITEHVSWAVGLSSIEDNTRVVKVMTWETFMPGIFDQSVRVSCIIAVRT